MSLPYFPSSLFTFNCQPFLYLNIVEDCIEGCTVIIITSNIKVIIIIVIVTTGWQERACEQQSLQKYLSFWKSKLESILSQPMTSENRCFHMCSHVHISPSPVFLGKHPVKLPTQTQHLKQDPAFPWECSCYGELKQHQPSWRVRDDIISSNFSGVDKTMTHSELEDW